MGWIASVRCQKFQCEFMARNFALIGPVQPISHQVSCSNETIQNAPKHYKTQQFMSLASNGVDRVRSLRKTLMRFRGTTSSLIALVQPVLHRVSCSNKTIPKCTQTVRNKPILEFRVQWCGSRPFVAKNSNASSWHEILH
jgi:hypothetical protein